VSDFELRPARETDLPDVFAVGLRAEHEEHLLETLDLSHVPAVLRHGFTSGDMRVAERDGAIIGYGASLSRGELRFLAQLFVVPEAQQSGVGRAVLEAVMPHDGRPLACVSTGDPRALAAYTRHGLTPRWPYYVVRRISDGLDQLPVGAVQLVEADPHDPALIEWDARFYRHPRPQDLDFLVRDRAGRPYWLRKGGATFGYAYINLLYQGSDAIFYGGDRTVSIGPLGVLQADQVVSATLAAARQAAQLGGEVQFEIMGPHPAFGPLLDNGFRIHELQTYMASDPTAVADPTVYLPLSGAHG
jgi:GNAT superfamily N-acetyltransferase